MDSIEQLYETGCITSHQNKVSARIVCNVRLTTFTLYPYNKYSTHVPRHDCLNNIHILWIHEKQSKRRERLSVHVNQWKSAAQPNWTLCISIRTCFVTCEYDWHVCVHLVGTEIFGIAAWHHSPRSVSHNKAIVIRFWVSACVLSVSRWFKYSTMHELSSYCTRNVSKHYVRNDIVICL